MIHETIESMEQKILVAPSMKDEDRQELLGLLTTLEAEVAAFEKTHPEEAESISRFAMVSVHEATRKAPNEQLLHLSLKGLASSIRGFEGTHEGLVRAINSMALILANMGL